MDNKINNNAPNADDCAIMDCSNQQYDWLGVECDELTGDCPISFICQCRDLNKKKINCVTTKTFSNK